MQLFVTDYKKKGSTMTIDHPEILSQVRKVLRAKIGDTIWVQSPIYEATTKRYEVRMDQWNDKEITWTIFSEQLHELPSKHLWMIVAMPNKWDKAEFIVQKLSEIGIDKIIFWPSERSVIKEWNEKKVERLKKIIKEAVEQSRGRKLPELQFTTDISEHIENAEMIVFDKREQESPQGDSIQSNKDMVWIIWPEGGFTAKDYQQFEAGHPQIIGLGETVMRMETAAIVGARLLKNNDKW
jgi:16S rRNA (uracil1498-N3)-methyltransferase